MERVAAEFEARRDDRPPGAARTTILRSRASAASSSASSAILRRRTRTTRRLGAQGFKVHHDTHDVFCLQVEGEKRWLVYPPVLELPLKQPEVHAGDG